MDAQENYRMLFARIKYWGNMSMDIAAYGEGQGIPLLVEHMEMTCGAIPDGEYEQVIDPSAARQFLELYEHVAEHRIAFAVTELLKLNDGYRKLVTDYFFGQGKTQGSLFLKDAMEKTDANSITAREAFEMVSTYLLSGVEWNECFDMMEFSEKRVSWKMKEDPHRAFWDKCGGDEEMYWLIEEAFVKGLLEVSGVKYSRDADGLFVIE